MLQLGQSSTKEYENIRFGKEYNSGFFVWPTKDDPRPYNVFQSYFELSNQKLLIERETYSALEWLGDVGGLFDGLRLTAHIFIGPIATYSIKSHLLRLFSQV